MAGIETLVVLDLEGTDLPDDSGILELHIRLVDLKTLKERATLWALPELPDSARPLNAFTAVMHERNGLLRRREERGLAYSAGKGPAGADLDMWASTLRLIPLATLEEKVAAFLKKHQGDDGARSLVLTGNSLANYDIPLLRRWMPGIFKQMHYRIYDVSVVRTHYREVLQQALPERIEAQITGAGTEPHRAADDTLTCLKTIRHLRAWSWQFAQTMASGLTRTETPQEHSWLDGWGDDYDDMTFCKGALGL